MKLAILSDVHANLEALQAVLRRISAEAVDRVVCLGDVVGYNANPAECIALLRELDPLWVAGNHDRAVTGQITTEGFSATAARGVAWTRARLASDDIEFLAALPLRASIESRLLAVHGALHPEVGCESVRLDDDERRRLSFEALVAHPSGARVCAFGHTHRVGIFGFRDGLMWEVTADEVALRDDAHYLVNPGAVGQSRTTDPRATYLVLDLARRTAAVRRVRYDSEKALAKTREAGLLPQPRFAFIPAPVRASLKRGARAVGLGGLVRKLGR